MFILHPETGEMVQLRLQFCLLRSEKSARLNLAKVCLGYHSLVRNSRFKNHEVRQRVERRQIS